MEQRHRNEAHAQERFAIIARYLTSALSQIAFCKQEGLPYWRFNCRLKQYRLREALWPQTTTPPETEKLPGDFIPLHLTAAEPAAPSPVCVIEFPSSVVVRFNSPVASAVFAQLIHARQAEP
ncbi:hypothetical protein HUU05_12445 [candidate division KSB1 bacterium]|nr:hypothetical protein [candidate division KSB1 bacterium]